MYNILRKDITEIIVEARQNKIKKISKEEVIKKLMIRTGWKKETCERWIETSIELGYFKDAGDDKLIMAKIDPSSSYPIEILYEQFDE